MGEHGGLEKMTESVSKRVLDKLDEISEDISDVKQQISGIKKQIEMQPQIDEQKHATIESKLSRNTERIDKLESNQRWVVLAVITSVIGALLQLVLH